MNPILPTIVAVAIFVLIGAVTLAAMRKYTFEQTMKIWQAQVGLLGTIIGMIGTFFFANFSINNARKGQATAETEVKKARLAVTDAEKQTEVALAKLEQLENRWASFSTYVREPEFRNVLNTAWATSRPANIDLAEIVIQYDKTRAHKKLGHSNVERGDRIQSGAGGSAPMAE